MSATAVNVVRPPMTPRRVAGRRLMNGSITVGAWIAAAIGIFMMGWILVDGRRARHRAPGTGPSSPSCRRRANTRRGHGIANCIVGTILITGRRRRRRPAARLLRRDLPVGVRPHRPGGLGHPRHHQHRAGRAVDHRRHVRLRPDRGALAPLLGLRGVVRAHVHHAAGHDAHGRGHPQPGAQRAARVGPRHGRAALAGHPGRGRQGGAQRPDHRRHPRRAARRRRDGAAALHRPQQPVLDDVAVGSSSYFGGPTANLTMFIWNNAAAPDPGLVRMAWGASLLIIVAVLGANILDETSLPARQGMVEHHGHDGTRCAAVRSRPLPPRLEVSTPGAGHEAADFDTLSSKLSVRDLDFFYGKEQALFDNRPRDQGAPRHRDHRPVGLRQVDAPALLQPHLRAVPRPEGGRRDHARRREHPRVAAPTCSACVGASA